MLVLSPLLLLLAAEGVARLVVPKDDEDPFLKLNNLTSMFSEVEVDGERYYQVTHADGYSYENVRFPIRKEPGTLRVFCLGGSASAGWPHHDPHAYSDFLRTALHHAYPDRKLEVLNVSAHAYASYRVRYIFDDVVRFDPDLLILWSGNNEFVEKRSYLPSSGMRRLAQGLARHSRLFEVLLRYAGDLASPTTQLSGKGRQGDEYFVWSQVEQLALGLRSDPNQLREVIDHYAYSIEHMVATAEDLGVPMLVFTVPVNLHDWHPNVSSHSVSGAELATWRQHYDAGCRHLLLGENPAAVDELRLATQADPEHAETWFRFARALEAAGDIENARAAYMRAKDLDQNPFRAISPLNDAVRASAARHPGVRLVDMEKLVMAATSLTVPGFDMFLDYVHPTREGNLVIAQRTFEAILDLNPFHEAPATRAFEVPDDGYRDAQDFAVQLHVLTLTFFMHQYEAFVGHADRVLEMLQGNADGAPLAALIREGRAGIQRYLDNRREELRGEPFEADYRDQLKTFYREFFGEIVKMKSLGGR